MFACENIFMELTNRGDLLPLIAVAGGSLIAIVAIVSHSVGSVVVRRSQERTKREIAAYVAEGTLDPDKAVAMLNAGNPGEQA